MTAQEIETMQRVDIGAVDVETLPDMSGARLDNTLSRAERIARLFAMVKNPYCFRYGDMAVKIEFAEDGPPLQDTLAAFLLRQKSGL